MSRVIGFSFASLILCAFDAFPAEGVAEKSLFVVRVEALKPVVKNEKQTAADRDARREGKTETFAAEFALESAGAREVSVELRAQQIAAMNGTPLVRSAPSAGSSRAPSGVGRVLDLLLPPGKPLLSKNPNARRDPLRILEE